MSGLEIERKFLVRKGGAFKRAAFSCSRIRQGYMDCADATVRVRLRDDKAYLTIKSHSLDGGLTRYEFETEITPDDALHLLSLCRGDTIDGRAVRKAGFHRHGGDGRQTLLQFLPSGQPLLFLARYAARRIPMTLPSVTPMAFAAKSSQSPLRLPPVQYS